MGERGIRNGTAQPLTQTDIDDLKAMNLHGLIVDIGGEKYRSDETYECDGCDFMSPNPNDLHPELFLCADCLE